MTFNLLNINNLYEVEETLKTTAFLTLTWMDNELQWTPSSHGNITEAFWPQVTAQHLLYCLDSYINVEYA